VTGLVVIASPLQEYCMIPVSASLDIAVRAPWCSHNEPVNLNVGELSSCVDSHCSRCAVCPAKQFICAT
jgi:hypothetical protein